MMGGPQAEGRGQGKPSKENERRKRQKKRGEEGEGKKNYGGGGKKVGENSQQLPSFGYSTTSRPPYTNKRSCTPHTLGENL